MLFEQIERILRLDRLWLREPSDAKAFGKACLRARGNIL
jgi:hypothetical protein